MDDVYFTEWQRLQGFQSGIARHKSMHLGFQDDEYGKRWTSFLVPDFCTQNTSMNAFQMVSVERAIMGGKANEEDRGLVFLHYRGQLE